MKVPERRKFLREFHPEGDKRDFAFTPSDAYHRRNAQASRALDDMKRALPKVPPPLRRIEEDGE